MSPPVESSGESGFAAERTKAFVDAVVAIALTLLILPLMESVGEIASSGAGANEWLAEHSGQLLSFVLSFLLIAIFWMIHHRLFTGVSLVTPVLMWLLVGWMLTIVWLPVATAIAGRMSDHDSVAESIYIGSLMMPAVLSLVIRLYLRAHPALHEIDDRELRVGIALDLSMILLFAIAFVIALIFPAVGYLSLFVTALSGVVQKIMQRMLGVHG